MNSWWSTVTTLISLCFQAIVKGAPSWTAGLSPSILGNSYIVKSPQHTALKEWPVATSYELLVSFNMDCGGVMVDCLFADLTVNNSKLHFSFQLLFYNVNNDNVTFASLFGFISHDAVFWNLKRLIAAVCGESSKKTACVARKFFWAVKQFCWVTALRLTLIVFNWSVRSIQYKVYHF